jgi:two-component sensor histidine kinase
MSGSPADAVRVILIEDNPGDVRLVREMLRGQSQFVLEVADRLSTGKELLDRGGVDVVLLDLGLVDSQGVETLNAVVSTNPSLPIVILTGLDDDSVGLQSIKSGGQDFLVKSAVTPETLRRTILHAIERKRMSEELRRSLMEKEMLLGELHHRVKNNLMVIIGLVQMEAARVKESGMIRTLHDFEGRLRSIALVYDRLLKSGDFTRVSMQKYIETLAEGISVQTTHSRDVSFKVTADGFTVDLDSAVPMGIILHELITNAYQHAFPGDWQNPAGCEPEIRVTVRNDGDTLLISVTDNGVGIPKCVEVDKSETMGMMLIGMLCRQIRIAIDMEREKGTAFHLRYRNSNAHDHE